MTGLAQIGGWLALVSLAQAGVAAVAVGIALRVVPADRIGLRHAIALGGLLVVTLAFAATAALLVDDWRAHVACWDRAAVRGSTLPAACASHGVSAERVAAGEPEAAKIAAVLSAVPGARVPGLPHGRSLARAGTGIAGPFGLAWLAALFLLGAREVRTRRSLHAHLARSREVRDPEALRILSELAAALDVRRPVDLRESPAVRTPCVAGGARPVVLLPDGLRTALRPSELRGVLAHELAHVCRRDGRVLALQRLAGAVFFFNPFVAWLSRRVRDEREAACDRVGAFLGAGSRSEYAATLLVIEGYRSLPSGSRLALPLLGESGLARRVRRLLAAPARRGIRAAAFLVAILTILAAGVFIRASLSVAALGSWAVMAEDVERRTPSID